MYPTPFINRQIMQDGFGISCAHKIFIININNNIIVWKRKSSNENFVSAKITVQRITKPQKKSLAVEVINGEYPSTGSVDDDNEDD